MHLFRPKSTRRSSLIQPAIFYFHGISNMWSKRQSAKNMRQTRKKNSDDWCNNLMFSCVLNFPLLFFSPPFCWTLSCLIYCRGNCRGCEVNSLLTNIQSLLVRRPLKMRRRRVSGHHRQVSSIRTSLAPFFLFSFLRSHCLGNDAWPHNMRVV